MNKVVAVAEGNIRKTTERKGIEFLYCRGRPGGDSGWCQRADPDLAGERRRPESV